MKTFYWLTYGLAWIGAGLIWIHKAYDGYLFDVRHGVRKAWWRK